MKKPKMGRPPLPKGESKDIQIGVRFKPDESKQLLKIAKDFEETPAEIVRDAAKASLQNAPIWTTCKWSVEELDDRKVRFSLYPQNGLKITTTGRLKARQRKADGKKAISIHWMQLMQLHPMAARITIFQVEQYFVDKLVRSQAGEETDFTILD